MFLRTFFLLGSLSLIQLDAKQSITFTKKDGADWTLTENQDVIVKDYLALTRAGGRLFNAEVEGDELNDLYSFPARTKWAYVYYDGGAQELTPCDVLQLDYSSGGYFYPPDSIGQTLIMRVIVDDEPDLFYNVRFTSWTPVQYDENGNITESSSAGGFSYIRDKDPLIVDDNLLCPRCNSAFATPSRLTPANGQMVPVVVSVPLTDGTEASVTIVGVGEDNYDTYGVNDICSGLANAEFSGSELKLRAVKPISRTLNSLSYTIYFTAKGPDESGKCIGQLSVCVPALPGFDCNSYGFDASVPQECAKKGIDKGKPKRMGGSSREKRERTRAKPLTRFLRDT